MPDYYTDFSVYLTSFLLVTGAAFMLLASVGILRLPDLPTRMHASTKAGALGASLTLLAVAVFIPELATVSRALAVIAFILLTAPVAAHVIGRAGYFVGVPLWKGTVRDDLAGHYDPRTHELISGLDETDSDSEIEHTPVVIEEVEDLEDVDADDGGEADVDDDGEADVDEGEKKKLSPDFDPLEVSEEESGGIEKEV